MRTQALLHLLLVLMAMKPVASDQLPATGNGEFRTWKYSWVVKGRATTFLFEPHLVEPGSQRTDDLLAAIRYVLERHFDVDPDTIKQPRPEREFLIYETGRGIFLVAAIIERDGYIRAFGVARR